MSDPMTFSDWLGLTPIVDDRRFPTPDELHSPTDAEIFEITEGFTDVERVLFSDAAFGLFLAKKRSGDRTPWRELVRLCRQGDEPRKIEGEIINKDGDRRPQVFYVEQRDGLNGAQEEIRGAIYRLSAALKQIENFDPKRHINQTVTSAVASIARTGHTNEERQRAKSQLIVRGYLELRRGAQGKLKLEIGDEFSQSPRQMDILIAEIKNEKKGSSQ